MGQINWNSEPKKIVEAVVEEIPHAVRWLLKKTGNSQTRQQLVRLADIAITTGEAQCLPSVIEYTSKSGNKWLMAVIVDKSGDLLECLMMYGLTEKYMWSATLINRMAGIAGTLDDAEVALFTPHFFQRLYERVGIEQEDRKLALRNFLALVRMMPVRVEDSRRKRGGKDVLGRLKGCVCYGHKEGRVLYFNTVLPETHMSLGNIIRTKGFREMSDSEYTTITEMISDAYNQERPVQWARKLCKEYSLGKRVRELLTYSIGIRLVCMRVIGEYRTRVSFLDPYDREQGDELLYNMIDEFFDKSIVATFDTLQSWLIAMLRATHKEVNPAALSSALGAVKALCGEGKVDWDKFHYGKNKMLDEMTKVRLL